MKFSSVLLLTLIFSSHTKAQNIPQEAYIQANKTAAELYFKSSEYRSVQSTGIGRCAQNWTKLAFGGAKSPENFIGVMISMSDLVELKKFSKEAEKKKGIFIKTKISNKIYPIPLCAEYRRVMTHP
jgi:hypothetical protein